MLTYLLYLLSLIIKSTITILYPIISTIPCHVKDLSQNSVVEVYKLLHKQAAFTYTVISSWSGSSVLIAYYVLLNDVERNADLYIFNF